MPEKKKRLNFRLLKAGDVKNVFGSKAGQELLDEYTSHYRVSRQTFPQAFRKILEAGNGILLGFHWQGKKRVPVGLIHFNETPKTILTVATFVSPKFNLPQASGNALLLPTAITLLVAGMFLLIARRNAIAMVLGYIMMENGIYLVGTSFTIRAHHIVEFGILLDVLAGVMIMAIILQNINQAFDDVDTALLKTLKE